MGMSELVKKVKKFTKRLLLFILIVGLLILSFFYFGTYSTGDRAGKVMKISEKGMIFKTYEGQINMEGFGAVRSENIFSQTFEFSVEGDRDDIIETLKKAMSKGKRVNIHYIERYWKISWRGDSKYFVREAEILDN